MLDASLYISIIIVPRIWYDRGKKKYVGERDVSVSETKHRVQVTFYTKAGCHLCEEAREMLDDIAAQTEYELQEIDIRSNLEIFEEYRYRIPVIIVNETTVIEGRISYSTLSDAFHV